MLEAGGEPPTAAVLGLTKFHACFDCFGGDSHFPDDFCWLSGLGEGSLAAEDEILFVAMFGPGDELQSQIGEGPY